MGACYFASDVHLTAVEDPLFDRFVAFLKRIRGDAAQLYLLGDLFEAWIGDDEDDALAAAVATNLRALADAGCAIAFVHGNRDFLLGPDYAARCGMALMPELSTLEIAGRRCAVLHGDTLCTDDLAYQQFRQQTRTAQWQQDFLAQALVARRNYAAQARERSALHTAMAASSIMDVNPQAVESLYQQTGADWIIHGHTHRPAVHRDGNHRRIVLGDWPRHPSWLRIAGDGAELWFEGGWVGVA